MRFGQASFLLLLGGLLLAPTAEADLVVVVNARAGVAVMSRNEVANVFLGRHRTFFNGLPVQPVDLIDGNPDRAKFYDLLLGKSLADINAYWSRQTFSGGLQPIARVSSADEVLKWVVARPGGIGFLERDRTDARVRVVYEFE